MARRRIGSDTRTNLGLMTVAEPAYASPCAPRTKMSAIADTAVRVFDTSWRMVAVRGPVLLPPCIRQRRFPRMAGAMQPLPLRVRAPQRGAVEGSPGGLPLIRRPRRESFMGSCRPKHPPDRRVDPTRLPCVLSSQPAHRGPALVLCRGLHHAGSCPRLPRLGGVPAMLPASAPAARKALGRPWPSGQAPVQPAPSPAPQCCASAGMPLARASSTEKGLHGLHPFRRLNSTRLQALIIRGSDRSARSLGRS